ncbi:hypothetical protein D7X30_22955 [Corallococcus sp. AB011P]|uniref:hypothetical protein n=1 Tax=Corallococcus sp. AB011P TaxID=2316735 RepID=UPI000EA1F7FA|nr:hypothetical protein [Corallococcus sp. AB011P]RKG56438.1 hypothetical protein D7X30_22955 [Corallococcus sp. AB011P]
MRNSKVSTLAALALITGAVNEAAAAPMSPTARPPPGIYSAQVVADFELLADSDSPNLVYFVPKLGNLAVQSPQSPSPIPRFQINSYYPPNGVLMGEELTLMGGTLSPTADIGALQRLQTEAALQGIQIAPAPVRSARTTFNLFAQQGLTGRVETQCVMEEYIIILPNGNQLKQRVPKCKVLDLNGNFVDSNVVYKFTSSPAPANSTANQNISFQAMLLPAWTESLKTSMMFGDQLDASLSATTEWQISANTLTRQARLTINWQSLFEQASAYTAFHLNSCVEVEISAFFERLATCEGGTQPCGVYIEYRQTDGTWSDDAPEDASFIAIVEALRQSLEKELFTKVEAVNGPVSTEPTAIFTLRANYEKIVTTRNEVMSIAYNQGPVPFNANTTLNIDCVVGGFGYPVVYDMDKPACRARVGQ